MIEAVLLFGVINAVFEFVLLSMIAPRWRLRILGNPNARACLHIFFLLANLAVHWGTLIGTMSAVLAFVASLATVSVAQYLWGYITDSRYYTVGFIKYQPEQLQ